MQHPRDARTDKSVISQSRTFHENFSKWSPWAGFLLEIPTTENNKVKAERTEMVEVETN